MSKAQFFYSVKSESDYDEEIEIACNIRNIGKLSGELTSKVLYIQSLPLQLKLSRDDKSSSRRATGNLIISIDMGKGITHWASRVSTKIVATKSAIQPIEFSMENESELDNKHHSITFNIKWDVVHNLKSLKFNVELKADSPGGDYDWPSRAATGYSGISNHGATCYINAMFQSLFATNGFRRIIYNIEPADEAKDFVFWLKYIFYALQSGTLNEIQTKKFIETFGWEEMSSGTQQDIQEFLRLLFDKLLAYTKGTAFEKQLTDMFVGTIRTTIRCDTGTEQYKPKEETFWDLPLPIDDADDIFDAIGNFLEPMTLTEFKCGDEEAEAVQEYEIVNLPPVLQITLIRNKFDQKTNQVSKNNNRFEYYRKLDLTEYCPGATYTLHSVLVHSGRVNSGHYTAYISPKADGKWIFFNDNVVERSSSKEAIDGNFGNGSSSTNAYMLVYVKDSCIIDILGDVSMNDVVSKDIILHEQAKEQQEVSLRKNECEIVVFTPEKLQMNSDIGQHAFFMHNDSFGLTFYVKKNITFQDMVTFLGDAFNIDNPTNDMVLWKVTPQRKTTRWINYSDCKDKNLSYLFKKSRVNFFIELLPFETPRMGSFDKENHVLVFIKEYDTATNKFLFVGHQYFDFDHTVHTIQEYVCKTVQYSGNAKDIALFVEDLGTETQMLDTNKRVRTLAKKYTETYVSTVTFEILEGDSKPKYLELSNKPTKTTKQKSNALNRFYKPVDYTMSEQKEEEKVFVIAKADTTDDRVLFEHDFDVTSPLTKIIEKIAETLCEPVKNILLLDIKNEQIEDSLLRSSLGIYQKSKHVSLRLTRSQKTKSLTFCYRIFDSRSSLIDESDIEMDTGEIMECEYDDCSLNTSAFQKTLKNLPASLDETAPNDVFLSLDNSLNEQQQQQPDDSINDWSDRGDIDLHFHDRSNQRDDISLCYKYAAPLSDAILNIVDVMDLNRSNTKFFDSQGNEISDKFLDAPIGKFLERTSSTIFYEIINNSKFRFHFLDQNSNVQPEPKCIDIGPGTTVSQLCKTNQKLLRMKGGIIVSIVPPDTLVQELIADGHDYRLNQNISVFPPGDQPFYICILFIGNSFKKLLNVPFLVEVNDGENLNMLSIKLKNILNERNNLDNISNTFEYEFPDPSVIRESRTSSRSAVNGICFVQPSDPDTIPVVLCNMHIDGYKPKKNDYIYDFNV